MSVQTTVAEDSLKHSQIIHDILKSNMSSINIENTESCLYDSDELDNLLKPSQNELKLLSLNIASLNKYYTDLIALLNSMTTNFDIIVLTEIRKNHADTFASLFEDYNKFYVLPAQSNFGGVMILTRNDLLVTELINTHIELIGVESIFVEFSLDKNTYLLGGIYKHPHVNIKEFDKKLTDCLDSLQRRNTILITGDINIDMLKYDTCPNTRSYFDNLISRNIYQVIKGATRITKESQTIIDHIYIKASQATKIKCGILTHPISDHLPTFLSIGNSTNTNSNERPLTRLVNSKSIAVFKEKMKALIDEVDNNIQNLDISTSWERLIDGSKNVYEESFPLIKISRKKFKNKPWFSQSLQKACKTKEKLYKKFLANKTSTNERKYKNYKNIYNMLIKSAKNNYIAKKIKADRNNKQLWNEVNSLLGKKRMEPPVTEINVNGTKITDRYEITNEFNEYFRTIGEKLARQMQDIPGITFQTYMPEPLDASIYLNKTDINEVTEIINNMKNKNSAGHDMVSPKLIKIMKKEIAPLLVKLINISIIKQIYPDCLKISKVKPIFKSGPRTDMSNYRPISLLPTVNKVFEKIIHSRLIGFIEKNNILFSKQYGFRKYHSTIDALIATHDHIIHKLNEKMKVLGIFIDLKKAFDSIDNEILIRKLPYYGIVGPFRNLIKAYLSNRRIYTEIQGTISEIKPIHFGVPQGSVLGPLLYLIYINDIKSLSEQMDLRLFADDTTVFSSEKSPENLERKTNEALKTLHNWLICNKLTLNLKKTHYLYFSKRQILSPDLNLYIGGHKLNRETQTKYLGLIIQDDLKWNSHINIVIKKLNRFIPMLYNTRKFLNKEQQLTIFKALIFPIFNYGIELYGNSTNYMLHQLQNVQNKILKIIYMKPLRTSTLSIHNESKILLVKDNYTIRLLLLIHKLSYDKTDVPKELRNCIETNSEIHSYPTRSQTNIFLRTTSFERLNRITDEASIVWNETPLQTRDIRKREDFKKKLIEDFIKSYNEHMPT